MKRILSIISILILLICLTECTIPISQTKKQNEQINLTTIENTQIPTLSPSPDTLADKQNTEKPFLPSDGYIGNKKSKKFHLPTCSTLPSEKNRVYFSEREKAISLKFTPCKNCRP